MHAATDDLIATNTGDLSGLTATYSITSIVLFILFVISVWKVFTKAGYPGWAAIIPIYNLYILVKIAGYHGALVILYFIPVLNIVISIIVAFGIGRAYGKSGVFSFFLLWVIAIVGYFIIGYGSARFVGPGGAPRDGITATA